MIYLIFTFMFCLISLKITSSSIHQTSFGLIINKTIFFWLVINWIYIMLETTNLNKIIQLHSSAEHNFFYKITLLWNNHETSFLFFFMILTLTLFLWFLTPQKNTIWKNLEFNHKFLWFLNWILLYSFISMNIFIQKEIWSQKSFSISPLLQDWMLVIHPPLLFVGYFSPFIISFIYIYILTNIKSSLQPILLKKTDVFLIYIWIIFTLGILLGSFWAYHELGWGGWWFWDPVENISLINWLLLTLLVHAPYITNEKLKLNIYFYCSYTYIFFSLINTFSIRLGLLNSVHSFAVDKNKMVFFIIFITKFVLIWSFYWLKEKSNIKKPHSFYYNQKDIILFGFFVIMLLFMFMSTYTSYFTSGVYNIKPTFYNEFMLIIVSIFNYYILKISFKRIHFNMTNSFALIFSLAFLNILVYTHSSFFSNMISQIGITCTIYLIYLIRIIFFYKDFLYTRHFINHHIIICSLYIILIWNHLFNYEVFLLIYPNEVLKYNLLEFSFKNLFFKEFLNFNGNIACWYIDNTFVKNVTPKNIFIEKHFYINENLYLSKHNIYSTLLNDFQFFLNSGNILEGWLFKYSLQPLVSLLWILILSYLTYLLYIT